MTAWDDGTWGWRSFTEGVKMTRNGCSPATWAAAAACAALLLVSCAEVAPVPTLEDAGGDRSRFQDLQEGRRLYVGNCSGCHGLFPVAWYSDHEWQAQVREMVRHKRVKLGGREREQLVRYLTEMNDRTR